MTDAKPETAAAAAVAVDSKSEAIGFFGFLESPVWNRTAVPVTKGTHPAHVKASAHTKWLYGMKGDMAVVHAKNIYERKQENRSITSKIKWSPICGAPYGLSICTPVRSTKHRRGCGKAAWTAGSSHERITKTTIFRSNTTGCQPTASPTWTHTRPVRCGSLSFKTTSTTFSPAEVARSKQIEGLFEHIKQNFDMI